MQAKNIYCTICGKRINIFRKLSMIDVLGMLQKLN